MLAGTNPTLLLNVLPLALRGLQPAQLAAREDDTVRGTALVQVLRDKLSMAVCAAATCCPCMAQVNCLAALLPSSESACSQADGCVDASTTLAYNCRRRRWLRCEPIWRTRQVPCMQSRCIAGRTLLVSAC